MLLCACLFAFNVDGYHVDLHVLTHSFPTRRSSDLSGWLALRIDTFAALLFVHGDEQLRLAPPALQVNQAGQQEGRRDRKSTRLNSSHKCASRMPSSPLKKKLLKKDKTSH